MVKRHLNGITGITRPQFFVRCLFVFGCFSQTLLASEVAQLDDLVQKWLQLEQQNSAVKRDWQQLKNIMQQRAQLLKAEKQQLENVLYQNQQNTSEVESQRADLLAQQTELESEQAKATRRLEVIVQQLLAFETQLPPPLLTAWQKEKKGLEDSSNASQQLQVALALLSRFYEFQNRISVHEMPIEPSDGQPVMVKQLYLGVAQAWFMSRDGRYRGRGFPTVNGWQWQFDESIDPEKIQKAIDIFEKRAEPNLIDLPLKLPSIAGVH